MGIDNNRIERVAKQYCVHLADDVFELPLEDRECYRINHLFPRKLWNCNQRMVRTIPVSAAHHPKTCLRIRNSNLLLADATPWAGRIVVTTLFAKRTACDLN